MAQPVNTYDSYDQRGIREDLSDVIFMISPEDTPFLTACEKTKAGNTYHEWQTDSLRAAADNAHIEGDDTISSPVSPTTRLGNYTQIFKNAVTVTDTDTFLKKAGRGDEMRHQIIKETKAQKLDIELALFANRARSAGAGGNERRLAGVPAWIRTNVDFRNGNGGANPTGDGTNARTDDGTPTAFSQTKFDTVMQRIWEAGGNPKTVYLSAFQQNVSLAFTGNNNQRSNVPGDGAKVIKDMAVYRTPWGAVKFQPSRLCRSRDVFIFQDDMWAVAMARPTENKALAKTGDNEKRQITTEMTLVARNEAANGAIYDNTTT